MNAPERFYYRAKQKNIEVIDIKFSKNKKAACLLTDRKYIFIDKSSIESTAEENVLMAEELGHYATGGLYALNSNFNSSLTILNRIKTERTAKVWGYKKLLPFAKIQRAVNNGLTTIEELLEYFDVTYDFFCNTLEYYKIKGLELKI